MLATILNTSTLDVYVSCINKTLRPGEEFVFSRPITYFDSDEQLKQLVVDDMVTLDFEEEEIDGVVVEVNETVGQTPSVYIRVSKWGGGSQTCYVSGNSEDEMLSTIDEPELTGPTRWTFTFDLVVDTSKRLFTTIAYEDFDPSSQTPEVVITFEIDNDKLLMHVDQVDAQTGVGTNGYSYCVTLWRQPVIHSVTATTSEVP